MSSKRKRSSTGKASTAKSGRTLRSSKSVNSPNRELSDSDNSDVCEVDESNLQNESSVQMPTPLNECASNTTLPVRVNENEMPSAKQEVIKYPLKFFKFKGCKGSDSLIYLCQLGDCLRKGKLLTACANSRGNLRKHVKSQHPLQLEEFNKLCKELDLDKSTIKSLDETFSASSSSQSADPNQPKLTQQKLSFTGYPKVLTQELLDSYIVNYLIEGVHPVYETTKDFFRNFVMKLAPGKKIRSQAFYKQMIEKKFSTSKSQLKSILAQVSWACTTADCWSSRGRQFLGVTIHWIDSELERKSACLAIKPVYGTCDYQAIASKLEAIYEEFDISAKIVATITDNGSNFLKAFHVYGTEPSAVFSTQTREGSRRSRSDSLHPVTPRPTSSLNAGNRADRSQASSRTVSDAELEELLDDCPSDYSFSGSDLDGMDEDDADSREEAVSASSLRNSTGVQEDEPEEFIGLTELLDSNFGVDSFYRLPPHRRCACHTLNLVAKEDIFKGSAATFLNIKSSVEGKVKKITRIQRRSAKASNKISENLGLLFIQPNATRWNSWYDTLKRMAFFLAKKRNELRELFDHFKIDFFRGPEEDYIKEFVKVMRPLAEALDILQADINVSSSHLLPTLKILVETMEGLESSGSGLKICKNLPKVIREAVQRRFSGYFENEELIVSSILHPKFKTWWLPEDQRKDKIKRLMELCEQLQDDQYQESEAFIGESHGNEMMSEDNTQDYFDSPKRNKRDFFHSITRARGMETSTKLSEVELYLADSSNNVKDLEKYPLLKKLYMKYNAALPSSASCERLFSVAGRIFSPVRSRVSDNNFERLLFLKFNSKVLG